MLRIVTLLLLAVFAGAQDDSEAPKSLRQHISEELDKKNAELQTAVAAKAYADAAAAKTTRDSLQVALKHADTMANQLAQAEQKQDFETCAKISDELLSVPHTFEGLMAFSEKGAKEEAKLEAKVDADKIVDKAGNTGLHLAAKNNDVDGARKLLEAGADPNKANEDGMTPLIICARKGRQEVAKLLVDAGADKVRTDRGSRTALMWSAEEHHLEVAKLLVDAGASKELGTAREGWRQALMWAAEEGHTEVAKMLIDAGSGK